MSDTRQDRPSVCRHALSSSSPALSTRSWGLSTRTRVAFYKRIRPELTLEAPRCFGGDYDPETTCFGLILEDLTTRGATFPNTTVRTTPDDTRRFARYAGDAPRRLLAISTLRERSVVGRNASDRRRRASHEQSRSPSYRARSGDREFQTRAGAKVAHQPRGAARGHAGGAAPSVTPAADAAPRRYPSRQHRTSCPGTRPACSTGS